MIHVYAITDALHARPAVRGLDSAAVEIVDAAGLRGIYSSHVDVITEPHPDSLWAHERVVEAAMRVGTVLPMRFGTTLPGPPALCGRLEQEASLFHRLLARVRGCVELAVRVALPADPGEPTAPHPGSDRLRMKLADHQRQEQAAAKVLVPLAELAYASATRAPRRRGGAMRASYLVPVAQVSRFADEVRRLQDENPPLELSCTGPWAPYSFVCHQEQP